MNFCPSRLLAHLAFSGLVITTFSASAQQTIIFSKPAESAEEKANSFMLEPALKLQGRAGQFNAPKQLFDLPSEENQPSALPPPVANQAMRDALNRRKNWTLMTPEEILGVTTVEKIFGLPDPTGDDKRTLEERYLRRHNQAAALSATNALRPSESSLLHPDDSPFAPRDQRNLNGQFSNPGLRPETESRKYFDRLVAAPADSPFSASPNADSAWGRPFTQPSPPPKLNLEQIAARERFSALMEPSAPPEKLSTPTRFAPAPEPAVNSIFQPVSTFNPVGRSAAPLQSGISRPTGILPLPSLTVPYPLPVTPKKSLADLPPWLTDGPQPMGGTHRRF